MKAADTSHAHGHGHPWYFAHHFRDVGVQFYAARLGMWLFLATEVLLFAGLFLGYTVFRWLYPQAFTLASRELNLALGTVNTVILISSSFTVAWAYHAIKQNKHKLAGGLLIFTLLCGVGFLVIKYFEYTHKFHVGQLPGAHFAYEPLMGVPGISTFYAVYFLTTGLHALHVIVGMTVLAFVTAGVRKRKYDAEYYIPVELGGLYWHLVDLVWIFLFPLLYLI
jgi:cytochrome c oxidase subunit III